MTSIEFLRLVWSGQSGYVFLPQKDGSQWVETAAFKWPDDEEKIARFLQKVSGVDQYYCPNAFTKPTRRKEFVKNPHWLYADLDAVDPKKLKGNLRPTVAIQSSPGRYQALWKLRTPLEPDRHESYNRRLTYAINADRGGWDLTQVLRVPGTRNLKYPARTRVRTIWTDGERVNLRSLNSYLRNVERDRQADGAVEVPDLILPGASAGDIRKRIWPALDARSRALLGESDSPPVGERSDRLWELECRLLEAGLDPEEVYVVVKDSVWNKFEERRDGDLYLWREIQKAHLHVGTSSASAPQLAQTGSGPTRIRPRLISYSDLLGSKITEPEWLVEDWWTMGSHGVIAGLPKSYKSLISLDLAVSIASETPFLGHHEVNPRGTGPVLVIQQENSLPLLRDRLYKISHSRGLQVGEAKVSENTVAVKLPPSIPVLFYNDFGFDMTMPDDREAIEAVIRAEGIKMVQFDPLYLMIGGADENSASEMRPILSWLLRLRNLYDLSVVVVHHWGKGAGSRGGRGQGGIRLLGSTTIYGWLEAALYLEAKVLDKGIQVVVEREFRERLSPPPIGFSLQMGDIGSPEYEWSREGPIGTSNLVLSAIAKAGEVGATLAWIKDETEFGQKRIREEVSGLLERGLIREETEGRLRRFYIASE